MDSNVLYQRSTLLPLIHHIIHHRSPGHELTGVSEELFISFDEQGEEFRLNRS